jgi:hypothetical protein
MLIAAVLSLCAAVATAAVGLRLLTRPGPADTGGQLMRAMAPTQLAAAAMLTVGGLVGLTTSPQTGWVVLIVCIIGAVGTVAAGSWQSAKAGAEAMAAAPPSGGCGTACATCTLSCSTATSTSAGS